MAGDVTDILRDWGKLDERGLSRAQGLTQVSGEPLHVILCRLGLVGEADMAKALAENLKLPPVGEANYPARPVVATSFLRTSRVLPLADGADAVAVAMADPLDGYAVEALELLLEEPVARWVAVPADVERLKDMASEVPVVRLVNQMIAEAVAARASDIQVEPHAGELRLRLRVDGMLRPVKAPPATQSAPTPSAAGGGRRRKCSMSKKNGRSDWIRTSDPLHPMQVRYQTAPRSGRRDCSRPGRTWQRMGLFSRRAEQVAQGGQLVDNLAQFAA